MTVLPPRGLRLRFGRRWRAGCRAFPASAAPASGLLNEPDDLQLLGGGISHSACSPSAVALFLSRRFSRVSSATTSFSALASRRRSLTCLRLRPGRYRRPAASGECVHQCTQKKAPGSSRGGFPPRTRLRWVGGTLGAGRGLSQRTERLVVPTEGDGHEEPPSGTSRCDPTQTWWCWRGSCSRLGTSKQMKSRAFEGELMWKSWS
jgi:hypothetical protein